ncbi:MAG: UDP-N-acetylglucosamine 2-epimerase (non-hydrolyzing) [Nitrospira sp.]|nr:MAG: UDP-N-acetylglucosamine 2-epimerase (non-hydrolyzing) [Nitrospira sp.]
MKISIIFGTRPEGIKLAPVILRLKREKAVSTSVCVTAQHREMLDQVLDVFGIIPDADLAIMRPNQSLACLTARAVEAIDDYLHKEKPDMVLVQGDTTTTFSASLAAFYNNIAIGHVEAGLRTGNLRAPWPEEANRALTSRLADLHFAPTERNRKNLLDEGVDQGKVIVTGNTGIDALSLALERVKANPPAISGVEASLLHRDVHVPVVLITCHRRENLGEGIIGICKAISTLAEQFTETQFIFPVHLNPNVSSAVSRLLGEGRGKNKAADNIHLIAPLPYLPFVALMNRATLILTDSGGIQEEAPSLGKPVLVMRDTTERPEAVVAGTVKVVGTKAEDIIRETARLLTDESEYRAMSKAHNPYGDGKATERILRVILERTKSGTSLR